MVTDFKLFEADRRTDRRTDIGDCRAAFETENLRCVKIIHKRMVVENFLTSF